MCKSIEAAITMVNRSIALAIRDDDQHYYMDYVKLHKLLYVAKCRALQEYKVDLFEDEIEAHRCGPLVRGIEAIPGKCGFDLITHPLSHKEFGTVDIPLTLLRSKAIDDTLTRYGTLSTDKIVTAVKNIPSFQKYQDRITDHLTIERIDLIQAGLELFS